MHELILKYTKLDNSIDTAPKFRAFILESSLLCLVVIGVFCYLSTEYNWLFNRADFRGVDPNVNLIFVFIFLCILILAKKGYYNFSAGFLIASLLLSGMCMSIRWGSLLPLGILMYLLTTTLAGILSSAFIAFLISIYVGAFLSVLSYLQFNNFVYYDSSWLGDKFDIGDALVVCLVLAFITVLWWYSKRKMDWLYKRSLAYEQVLTKQNALLKNLVVEKIEEVKFLQQEHLNRMNNLIEIGKNTSGFIHDISNMLTSVSLSIENVSTEFPDNASVYGNLSQTKVYVHKIRDYLDAYRKQLLCSSEAGLFNPDAEVVQVVDLFSRQCRSQNIKVLLDLNYTGSIHGNSAKLFQVFKNLFSNSIEALDGRTSGREIRISTKGVNDFFIFEIYDNGCGVGYDQVGKLFELFYSTKHSSGGTGLGLATSRDVVENLFRGKILAYPQEVGMKFEVTIPSYDKNTAVEEATKPKITKHGVGTVH